MGGNSGGGDPSAYQRELKAEQDKAIAKLNGLFGVGDAPAVIDRNQFYAPGALDTYAYYDSIGDPTQKARDQLAAAFDQKAYDTALTGYKKDQLKAIYGREDLYDKMGGDVYDYQKSRLDEQQQKAARQLSFALARNGQMGGSLAIDQENELSRNYQNGIADVANTRISTINNARAADEQSRIDLISRIRAGMDQASAINSASTQLQNNIAQGTDAGLAKTMQDYFGGMGYLNQQNQYQQQRQNTYRPPAGFNTRASNGALGAY